MAATQPNSLKPQAFTDPAVLVKERDLLFRRQWHLAGLARDLPVENDWFLTEIAGTEIIVQHTGSGQLRAFVNTCPHRFNALVSEPSGNGRLRCSYHFWSFDGDGMPAQVPLRPGLPLEACQTAALSLRRWQVDRCGELIFVSEAPAKNLDAFLGPLAKPLADLSRGLGEEVLRLSQEIAANWKVILQNTVEFDHAFAVHPDTFAPMVDRPLQIVSHETTPPHLAYHTVMKPRVGLKPIEQRIEEIFARSVIPKMDGYTHWTLFPSSTIGTTENRQFALIRYQPISPGVTRAEYRLFVSKIAEITPVEQAILDRVVPADVAFTRQLLEEDRRICESVQRGLNNAPPDMEGILMPGEHLVARFQQYWLDAMGGGALTSNSEPKG